MTQSQRLLLLVPTYVPPAPPAVVSRSGSVGSGSFGGNPLAGGASILSNSFTETITLGVSENIFTPNILFAEASISFLQDGFLNENGSVDFTQILSLSASEALSESYLVALYETVRLHSLVDFIDTLGLASYITLIFSSDSSEILQNQADFGETIDLSGSIPFSQGNIDKGTALMEGISLIDPEGNLSFVQTVPSFSVQQTFSGFAYLYPRPIAGNMPPSIAPTKVSTGPNSGLNSLSIGKGVKGSVVTLIVAANPSGQTFTAGTANTILFNSSGDALGEWIDGTGIFTPRFAGVYRIRYSVGIPTLGVATSGTIEIQNSAGILYRMPVPSLPSGGIVTGEYPLSLSGGAAVSLSFNPSGTITSPADGTLNWLVITRER